jgi:hypothetical protein
MAVAIFALLAAFFHARKTEVFFCIYWNPPLGTYLDTNLNSYVIKPRQQLVIKPKKSAASITTLPE